MLRILLSGLVAATFCVSTATAQDAGKLKEQCSASDQAPCYAYVAGVVDTLRMLSYKTAGGFFCAPQGTPGEKYVSVTTTYLSVHPEGLKYNAADEVMIALMQAFPCERVGEHQLPLPPPTTQPIPPRGN
jgi:Rap1a immunity proteins